MEETGRDRQGNTQLETDTEEGDDAAKIMHEGQGKENRTMNNAEKNERKGEQADETWETADEDK